MSKLRDKFYFYTGCLATVGLPAFWTYLAISTYRKTWEFGRYGMPRSLVDATGTHYADGTPIFPIEQKLIRSGQEEEFRLMMLLVLLFLVGNVIALMWRYIVVDRKMQIYQTENICAASRRMQPGEGQLVNTLVARQWLNDDEECSWNSIPPKEMS